MKKSNASRLLLAAVLCTVVGLVDATAQNLTSPGQVVDVVDGRTAVVAVPGGRVNLQLQFVEVPAAGQPLHDVVREHLRHLLVGRSIQFRAGALLRDATIGQILLNGVDVSQQLLRDGAAWLQPQKSTGQTSAEYAAYAEFEAQARKEKRGVWGVDIKPPWEQRLEKAVAEIPPVSQVPSVPVVETKKKEKAPTRWGDKNPWLKTPTGLAHGYNAASQTGFFGTSLLGVKDSRNPNARIDPNAREHTMVDITYVYTEFGEKGRKGVFVITLISQADEWRFLTQNSLKVAVDGKEFSIAKPTREAEKLGYKLVEKLTFRVDRSTIEKVALGADVTIKVGNYWMQPTVAAQMILYNMLELASDTPPPAEAANRPVKNK